MDSWLSILGSVASIGGAIYAYRQTIKARSYATKAEQMRDEFIGRRHLVEVSQVHAETKRILKLVSKIGSTCTPMSIKGIDITAIAQDLEEYSQFLNAQSADFTELFGSRSSELCESLNKDIEALVEASEFIDIKSAGTSIYYKIYDFLPIIKSATDTKREQKLTF